MEKVYRGGQYSDGLQARILPGKECLGRNV